MYCLTDEQIEYILSDIRRNGVEMEDLQYNLLDHICCMVEQELEEDGNFEQFYRQVIKRFYQTDLREIEEETIRLLTFKNYYAMKRTMMVSGIISASAFVLGSLFKIMHWPGAGILLTLGIVLFSFLFLPLLLLLKTREATSGSDKAIIVIGTITAVLYCLSMLFLVQHWPGARVLWVTTLALSALVLIPAYFFTGIRKPEAKANTIVITIMLLAVLGIQFTLTAIRPSSQSNSKTYTYLQSQLLLDQMQSNKTGGEVMVQNIQQTCEAIKAYLLETQTGVTTIPQNFEQQQLNIQEVAPDYFMETETMKSLVAKLRQQVNEYNAKAANKIPVSNSILDPGFAQKDFCSNLFVLNNITQIQLFLAGMESKVASVN